jgi:hypothetical protein
MIETIRFPASWINSQTFEDVLRKNTSPHDPSVFGLRFVFPIGCKLMIDAAIKILCLSNQLCSATKTVRLEFEEGENGTMGYIDSRTTVIPARPAKVDFSGNNDELVEIARINPRLRDQNLPTRLADALSCGSKLRGRSAQKLSSATFTVFAELVDNIYKHASSDIDGYAALQTYSRGNKVTVIVSDSGRGLMSTLRPALVEKRSKFYSLSDEDLLVEMVTNGVSRFGDGHGCGIKASANQFLAFNASMDFRLPTSSVKLNPSPNGGFAIATVVHDLPLLWGTHITLNFQLTSNSKSV